VEDLLVAALDMGGRRDLAVREDDAADAGADGARGAAEVEPAPADVAELRPAHLLDLVPVRDRHRKRSRSGDITRSRALPSPSTPRPRTTAAGTARVFPITSSAAAAISSATAITVACSS